MRVAVAQPYPKSFSELGEQVVVIAKMLLISVSCALRALANQTSQFGSYLPGGQLILIT